MQKNTLKKYLSEVEIDTKSKIIITHSNQSQPEWLIPPLFKEKIFQNEILYSSFGNSFSFLKSLLKRHGLGKSAKKQFEYLNLEDKVAGWVGPDYPIIEIKNDMHSKGFMGYECQFYPEHYDPLSFEFYEEIFEYIEANFGHVKNFVLTGIEFLILYIDAAISERKQSCENKNEMTVNFYIGVLLESLINSHFEKIVISYNRECIKSVENAPSSVSIENLLTSFSEIQLNLLDLKSGYSKQMTGHVQFKNFPKEGQKKVEKLLKFKCNPDSVNFFDRVQI